MYLPYHEPDAQQMYCTCKLIVSFETSVLNTLGPRDNRFNDHLILRLSTLRSRSTLVSVTAGQRKEITVELRRKGQLQSFPMEGEGDKSVSSYYE
jgi:hypothetical protein